MSDEAKLKAASERRKRRIDFLSRRIPELHNQGVLGAKARVQADAEFRESEK